MKLLRVNLAVASALEMPNLAGWQAWENFKTQFSKNYDAEEHSIRKSIFLENYAKIQTHNSKKLSYRMGVNQFSDLNNAEFQNLMLMQRSTTTTTGPDNSDALPYPEENWEFECPKRFEGAEISVEY